MKDTLTSRNHQDFRARYQGTYGYYVNPDNAQKVPVYVANCNQHKVTFQDIEGRDLFANVDTGIEFEFIPLDRGFFQTINGKVYYLQRVPARQWKRGICYDNTQVHELTNNLRSDVPNLLEVIAKLRPIDCAESWYLFNGKVPVALSKHFAISTEGRLYFYNKSIGTVDHKTDTIKLVNDMLQQELTDLFRRNNISVTITL